jgi:hypothetical protein
MLMIHLVLERFKNLSHPQAFQLTIQTYMYQLDINSSKSK